MYKRQGVGRRGDRERSNVLYRTKVEMDHIGIDVSDSWAQYTCKVYERSGEGAEVLAVQTMSIYQYDRAEG